MATNDKNKSSQTPPNDVFDIRRVRRLVELMKENDLTELLIQQGELKIQLQRGATLPASLASFANAGSPMPVAVAPAVSTTNPTPADSAVNSPPADGPNIAIIKSPMVGTFYVASDPTSPPFVKIGDRVEPEKTVCLIEAMKVYNEIQAEVSGTIVAVLVKNAQPVEFGTPLFKVDTQG